MDGIELSQQIRRRYPRCRIMIISGYEDFEAARSAIELGALRYMLKPINHTEMVAYVRSVLKDVVREQDEHPPQHRQAGEPAGGSAQPYAAGRALWWRRTHRQGNGGLLRRAPCGGEPPRRKGVPSLRPAVEKALKSRGGPGYLIRAEGAQALLLCDFGEEDVSLAGRPAAGAGGRGAVSVAVGWDGGAARSGEVHQSGRRAWRCGGPTWRMGMPSVSTTT